MLSILPPEITHYHIFPNLAPSEKLLYDIAERKRTNVTEKEKEELVNYAAQRGHLEVLKWARENGCPWYEKTCAYAAAGGHLEVLKWARANGCPWDERTCTHAAEGGHLEVLKWARLGPEGTGR